MNTTSPRTLTVLWLLISLPIGLAVNSGCGSGDAGTSTNSSANTTSTAGPATTATTGSTNNTTASGAAGHGVAAAAGRAAAPAVTGSGTAGHPASVSTPAATSTMASSAAGTSASPASPSAAGTGTMAAAGSSGAAGAAGGMTNAVGAAGFPQLPRVMTTDGPGPFKEVVKVKNTPGGGWLIYPKDIGKGGMKHPIFIFGPGAGTGPQTYDTDGMHWDRYGSYGFAIYAVGTSDNGGMGTKNALDWMIKQNDDMSSPLYHNLDTSKICVAGHSLGSIMTFAALPDDRVTTSIHISGGSFDGNGSTHLTKETMFMCGPDGNADLAEPQCEVDYMKATVPIFYTKVQGATHITSARLGWAATIAWLLWHLADQGDQWKKEFLEPTGQFQTGIYKSEVKNWN